MRRFILPLIIFAVLALVAARLLNERENTLVTRSRRLLTTRHTLEHEWLDQDRILYREYHNPREFRILNVSTGSDTAVLFGDPRLSSAQHLMGGMLPLPDGESFITFISYGSGDAVWVPLKKKATRLTRWPSGRFLGWLDGGKSFLMDVSQYPEGFGGELPKQFQRYRWPELEPVEPLTLVEPLLRTEQGPSISWYPAGLFGSQVHFYSVWGKDTNLAWVDYSSGAARSERALLPVDRHVFEAVLSPDGKQLLWTLNKDPGTSLNHLRFWLSTADGTALREVAHTGESPTLPDIPGYIVPEVKWRPDSLAVSVQHRNGVFLLPLR
jgi:hypothetical protein